MKKEKAAIVYDLMIRRTLVIDGGLSPAFSADVGIKDGIILKVGDLSRDKADRVLEGRGYYLAPGFIDIHSHSDFSILVNPRAESKIRQGVTTEVIGNCGSSSAPLYNQKLRRVREQNRSLEINWATLKEYRSRVEGQGSAVNIIPLTGQGNIRASVIGYDERKPTRKEMVEMISLLERSLEEGSWGISTGLVYPPGVYSDFDELLELISPVAQSGGIYATHMRNESDRVDEAVDEAIRLAETSGVPLEISHLKAQGKKNWSRINACFAKIESAQEKGLNIHCDRYPYTASSTDLDILLPEWAYRGGAEEELRRLSDPAIQKRIKEEITRTDWGSVVVSSVSTTGNKYLEGKGISEIAEMKRMKPVDCLIGLLLEEKLKVEALFFSLSPDNLKKIMLKPYCLLGSDGSARAVSGPLSRGKPHPRAFGSFPRFLREFAGKGLLSWEEAVHKMTGLTARKLGLRDRGLIKEGMSADLVLFHPDKVRDKATYDNPHQYPDGIEYVIVNGEIVVEKGEHTDKLPGRFLVQS